jgi:hypothetical protein
MQMNILCLSVFGVGNAVDKIPTILGMIDAGHTVDVVQDSRGVDVMRLVPGINHVFRCDADCLRFIPDTDRPKHEYDVVFNMAPSNNWLQSLYTVGKQVYSAGNFECFVRVPDYQVNLETAWMEGLIAANYEVPIPYLSVPSVGKQNIPFFMRGKKKIAGFHTGCQASWPWKRMSVRFWHSLLQYLADDGYDYFCFFGSSEDFLLQGQLFDPAMHTLVPVWKQSTKIPIATVVTMIRACHAFFSNDSGLLHVAAAAGVKSYGFFGPTCARKNRPYGNVQIVTTDTLCRPCQFNRSKMEGCRDRSCLDPTVMFRNFLEVVS